MWINLIRILSITLMLAGGIIIGVGSSSIPQTVTNTGDRYIGHADSYNTDLRNAQIGSSGFKLAMSGVGVCVTGFLLACGLICHEDRTNFAVHPIPPIQPIQRRVRINPQPSVITVS